MDMMPMFPQPCVPPGAAARTRDLNFRQVFEGIIGWMSGAAVRSRLNFPHPFSSVAASGGSRVQLED